MSQDRQPELGVNIAVFEQGRLLLTLREDFEVWCLPGVSFTSERWEQLSRRWKSKKAAGRGRIAL